MHYEWLGLFILLILFLGILFTLYIGQRCALWQEHILNEKKSIDTHVTESAIFALLGLLIALTFNSASVKFDDLRLLIIDEANAISTAYLRLDLLPEPTRTVLKKDIRDYLDMRLSIYKNIADTNKIITAANQLQLLQQKIWNESLSACMGAKIVTACLLLMPALNNMFDIANTRNNHLTLHPPIVVFLFLFTLGLFSSFIVGYNMPANKHGGSLLYFGYVIIMATTLYIIMDMEYPRVGYIRIDDFDQALIDVKKSM